MWPWEHLAFGYLLYSGYARLWYRRPPTDVPVIVLAVATQVPDLIDKPLAWSFEILPSARSLGHSVFFAFVVVTAAAVVARRRGTPKIGAAVAVGYLSHLLGDVLYPVMVGDSITGGYLFWPLVRQSGEPTPGIYEETIRLLGEFVVYLGSPDGTAYLVLELGIAVLVVLLWIADGWPGLWMHQ